MGSPLSACGTWGGAKALFTLHELNWIHRTELESWTRANKWERSHRMNWSSSPGLLYEVGRCDVRWTVRVTNAWSNWVDSNWVSSVQLMCCERGVGDNGRRPVDHRPNRLTNFRASRLLWRLTLWHTVASRSPDIAMDKYCSRQPCSIVCELCTDTGSWILAFRRGSSLLCPGKMPW